MLRSLPSFTYGVTPIPVLVVMMFFAAIMRT